MTNTIASSTIEDDGDDSELSIDNPSGHRRFAAAIVLILVFLVLVLLAVWLYPNRGVVNRPPPFALTMWSAVAPKGTPFGAGSLVPTKIVPDGTDVAPSDVSDVAVTVAPSGSDQYRVHVAWTYSPSLCASGEILDGCGSTTQPFDVAESELSVSLPTGATIVRCHECVDRRDWLEGLPTLTERDTTIQPSFRLTESGALSSGSTTPAKTATASWDFEVRDTSFAWSANGLNAEAGLPVVNFQDNGNVGYGNVTVTYGIPEGNTYDWNDGPGADHLTWTEPASSAATAVQVAGINNSASADDTRNVLIVGILLGAAGGALVGAIQEIAHAESDGRGAKRRGWARRNSRTSG